MRKRKERCELYRMIREIVNEWMNNEDNEAYSLARYFVQKTSWTC
jgi:hypothetical protein